MINPARARILREGEKRQGPVIYWMQRDQRAHDNWALLFAQELAVKSGLELIVVFCLAPSFNNAALRHYRFMLNGLIKTEAELEKYNIPFMLLKGKAGDEIPRIVKESGASVLVSDFNPLKNVAAWKKEAAGKINIPFYEVDAHNIVPCFIASPKAEFGAYTIRPKINRLLDAYLEEFPRLKKMKINFKAPKNNWDEIIKGLRQEKAGNDLSIYRPGEDEALKALQNFMDKVFPVYAEKRNDPSAEGTSGLSPYFHFGHLAPQRAALAIERLTDYPESQKGFLEELIIRRELADNFCFYNGSYDSFDGFHSWAKETLNAHRKDKREYIYDAARFEEGATHDTLWNAAQKEMVITGRMHGFMRMYWAKKILEWTPSPEEALKTAIYLNDKYELDGRDPNGYAGIAWAIGGVHDRAWGERKVFGKIRYMNFNGCKRKFNVDLYINKINTLNEQI